MSRESMANRITREIIEQALYQQFHFVLHPEYLSDREKENLSRAISQATSGEKNKAHNYTSPVKVFGKRTCHSGVIKPSASGKLDTLEVDTGSGLSHSPTFIHRLCSGDSYDVK